MTARQPFRSLGRCAAAASLLVAATACPVPAEDRAGSLLGTAEFKEYWFSGKAELTRYELEQARYGELHAGDAVLIFVTEDFLPDRQVKADSLDRAETGAWPVLKLNATRSFVTGLYPYSMMTSVFTPLDVARHPRTLKTTTSVQEWCGQTYLQLNLRDGRYRVLGRSYFESEGDRELDLEPVWLEDEIWTRIRLAPQNLPVGTVRIIPGSQQSRLRHRPLAVETATARLDDGGAAALAYTLSYPDAGRELTIRFARAFPHAILGWEETYHSGFGPGARKLTTRARRTDSLRIDYWTRNSNADRPLRQQLGLQ